MSSKELFKKGLKNRREVLGDAYVDRSINNGNSEFAFAGQKLTTEWCWGETWSRPGLTRQQRSLLSKKPTCSPLPRPFLQADNTSDLGILVAIKSWPELGVHVRGALRNGVTELEIREAIVHATIYTGVPAGVEAFKVASRVIDEMVANGEHERQLNATSEEFVAYTQ
ncbi:4-carboxymuconolactone decarboxylase [Sporothrix schenckii 1099-18]|uniref:4-carboxymuconolactone decarboxylase n=1 Tax=Sporothrix schenckii 1099-18 TaxID=1397361 RepID=A0A0F2MFY6_SPOSC|nr:4-carboxymuconolactone decarboxylase [Sporothrix schenckii 1099-18]KJR87775.1 4-carboxymuconolactone decarboxylase [Sporothrix schenckii 1099-18]